MPRSKLIKALRDVPYFLGFNSYTQSASSEDTYTIVFDCYLCKGLLTEKDKDKFLSYDGKLADSWRTLYNNADEWLSTSKLSLNDATKGTCIGENYGDIPAPFKVIASNIEKDASFKVGNCNITIKEKCSDFEWDSKTGIVLGKPENEQKVRPINYTGTSYGTIPLLDTPEKESIYYQKGEIVISADGYQYEVNNGYWGNKTELNQPLPFTIEYDYWYY